MYFHPPYPLPNSPLAVNSGPLPQLLQVSALSHRQIRDLIERQAAKL